MSGGDRFSSKGSWMFFSSVRQGRRLASWKIIAICGCGRVIGSSPRRIRPPVKMMQSGHRPEQRRLPAAGRTDDAEELALAHLDRDIVERVHRTGARLVEFGRALDHHLRPRGRFGRGDRHVHDGGAERGSSKEELLKLCYGTGSAATAISEIERRSRAFARSPPQMRENQALALPIARAAARAAACRSPKTV